MPEVITIPLRCVAEPSYKCLAERFRRRSIPGRNAHATVPWFVEALLPKLACVSGPNWNKLKYKCHN